MTGLSILSISSPRSFHQKDGDSLGDSPIAPIGPGPKTSCDIHNFVPWIFPVKISKTSIYSGSFSIGFSEFTEIFAVDVPIFKVGWNPMKNPLTDFRVFFHVFQRLSCSKKLRKMMKVMTADLPRSPSQRSLWGRLTVHMTSCEAIGYWFNLVINGLVYRGTSQYKMEN